MIGSGTGEGRTMRIVSMSPYARVRRRWRESAIWAFLSWSFPPFGLNLPQKDWEGREPLVDLRGIEGRMRVRSGEGERYGVRRREKHSMTGPDSFPSNCCPLNTRHLSIAVRLGVSAYYRRLRYDIGSGSRGIGSDRTSSLRVRRCRGCEGPLPP